MDRLYPLRFKEILRNYAFGGRRIEKEFRKTGLPADHTIGETWEVCDRPGESSEVINGSLKGRSLHELITDYGAGLLGTWIVKNCGTRFPLLIKFLDATNPLGEQAHHSDELAKKRGFEDPGKTEAWYMLRTKPGATVECGNIDGVTKEKLLKEILDNNSRSCMTRQAVGPGDCFLLYAGTMHYSDGGVLFYEIMQNSDVYIGLRPARNVPEAEKEKKAREAVEGVGLEDGFDCKTVPVETEDSGALRTFAVACRYFALERLDITRPFPLECGGQKFYVMTQIEGESEIVNGPFSEELKPGLSCLLAASIGKVRIQPRGKASFLLAYVPDLREDIIRPLRAKGISDDRIIALGGKTEQNHLLQAIRSV